MNDNKVRLLLIVEKEAARPKAGLPSLAHTVSTILVDANGPLDSALHSFAEQRPSTVTYERIEVARTDQRKLAELSCMWLPQVRLVRKNRILLRSAIVMSDTGQFLISDVGGQSYVRRGKTFLLDALAAELDK